MAPQKSIAFLGASTGVGLSALKKSLAEGNQCTALCRYPKKLSNKLGYTPPNLRIIHGNAHDVDAVARCLQTVDGQMVDEVVSTIGALFIYSKFTLDDPNVCEKGIDTLLRAIANLREKGVGASQEKKPHIIVCSTTGMSRHGRDVPLPMLPVYRFMLKTPHADKRKMEDKLMASGERYTIIRPSHLVDSKSCNPNAKIRTGVEDANNGLESRAIGYYISREDAGNWIAENLVLDTKMQYLNKTVTITY